jgi:phenylalanyl-tRNA synthetase beta chain
MPVVEVDPDELRVLAGREDRSDDDLRADLFALGLEFEGETPAGAFELEFAPDRLDRLSVEGIARSLRYHYGEARGVHIPSASPPDWRIIADPPADRPCITGAVVRGVDLDESSLASLIQLQEKLHATIGRDRAKGAIGIHDLTMMKGAAVADSAADVEEAADSVAQADPTDPADPADGADPTDPADPSEVSDADVADVGSAAEHATPESVPANAVHYTGVDPDGPSFVPLETDTEMTPADVLRDHPTGRTYADLVDDPVPALTDGLGLFSFPPVINGRRTEVTTDSRDLFIESTGTDQWTIDRMCTIVCYALTARGGSIERVTVDYVDDGRTLDRPDLETETKRVSHERIERTLGVDLRTDQVVDRLERSGLDGAVVETGDDEIAYDVTIPPYRVDVLHPRDVVDDVGRAHGFNELEPRYPDVSTVGGRHADSRRERAIRETLVGLGFQDCLNFHLTGIEETFHRMALLDEEPPTSATGIDAPSDANPLTDGSALGAAGPVTISEPYSAEYEIVRTWALPSLLQVLENNTHRAYPQHLSEIGLAAHVDPDAGPTGVAERQTVAGVLAATDAGYEDAKARVAALARAFDVDLATPPTDHPSFIDGRTAAVELDGQRAGVLGELRPAVLVEHDLEVPVAGFEVDAAALGGGE